MWTPNTDPKPYVWVKSADEILARFLALLYERLRQDARAKQ